MNARHWLRLLLVALAMTPVAAQAVETGLMLQLGGNGDFERRVVVYDCGAETALTVTYVNAAPNFLAIVPMEEEPEPLIFAAVASGSGARYAASHWVWLTSGPDAELRDIGNEDDAEPVLSCSELNNTP